MVTIKSFNDFVNEGHEMRDSNIHDALQNMNDDDILKCYEDVFGRVNAGDKKTHKDLREELFQYFSSDKADKTLVDKYLPNLD